MNSSFGPVVRIDAVVLAAGSSSRMGAVNKLVVPVDGVPMVRRVIDAAQSSRVERTFVVVRPGADEVCDCISEDVTVLVNEDAELGMSTSVRTGLEATDADGVVILLGDMPWIRADLIDTLIDAFEIGRVCVPTTEGRRGNPVLWSRELFGELADVDGDRGGRDLVDRGGDRVRWVDVGTDAILRDVDRPTDLHESPGP
ncbi:MAG: nucleotidyltransferase family protein [Gemmatimonadota bacterium]